MPWISNSLAWTGLGQLLPSILQMPTWTVLGEWGEPPLQEESEGPDVESLLPSVSSIGWIK